MNSYCERLGIAVPSLAAVRTHPEAKPYALLIVALLEKGEPMTLAEVATRFDAAGIAPVDFALDSLKRCRPARPPVYRDGDRYALDPHDAELDLWAFRLGLRAPRVVRADSPPAPARPPADQRLSLDELDTAWRNDVNLHGWSAQRIALAILDAHDRPMRPEDVVGYVSARTKWHKLAAGPTTFRRAGAAVAVGADGLWSTIPGAPELGMARDGVRDLVQRAHRWPVRSSTAEIDASRRDHEKRRAAHAAELAAMKRVIVHAFPSNAPRAVVLVDVERRRLTTLVGDQVAEVGTHLEAYDVICGVEIRATLRVLGIDPEARRLAEIGAPQKTVSAVKVTTAMFVQSSCGIRRPLGDARQLGAYLAKGQLTQLRQRLEADAKSLYAFHEYGRLHGAVRLRSGFFDEMFPAPWLHRDEPWFYLLMKEARDLEMGIVAVVGAAPSWEEPWGRAQRLVVQRGEREHDLVLVDERGRLVDQRDVQLARLEAVVH